MTETDISDMTTEELHEAAVAEANDSDRDDDEPVHGDVGDCPKCGSSETGRRDGLHGEVFGCNDCLFRWE